MAILYGQQRILDPLEYWLRLFHSWYINILFQKSNPAYGADHYRRASAEHLQQLKKLKQL